MAEYYIPSYPITDELISAQFVDNTNVPPHQETINWNKFLDVYEAVLKEKLKRFSGIEVALAILVKWITIDKSSDDYKHTITILGATMSHITNNQPTENDIYRKYMSGLVDILKGQIDLYEYYFDSCNLLERNKFKYALRARGPHRTDLMQGEEFSGQDVLNYLNSMITGTGSFDRNIQKTTGLLRANASNEYANQAIGMLVSTFQKQKNKHMEEIRYYQNICAELGVSFNVRVR
jgi:hypothetical protein